MICDDNKGKMTYGEVLNYDLGLLQYLWVRAMKNLRRTRIQQNRERKKSKGKLGPILPDIAEVLDNI